GAQWLRLSALPGLHRLRLAQACSSSAYSKAAIGRKREIMKPDVCIRRALWSVVILLALIAVAVAMRRTARHSDILDSHILEQIICFRVCGERTEDGASSVVSIQRSTCDGRILRPRASVSRIP